MKILGITRADASSEAGEMPSLELMENMGKLMEEVTAAGVILDTDGLKPSSFGKRITVADGKTTVVDGPFTESKELIASYAVFQVETWDEALYWTRRFLECVGGGTCELRPVFEASDFPADLFPPEAQAAEEAMREQMKRNAAV